jgi:hypothetical protein
MKSSHYQNSEGVIAAWAADEDMLGHQTLVRRYLNQQAQAGHLNSLEIKGHTFVVALQRFLKQQGYLA